MEMRFLLLGKYHRIVWSLWFVKSLQPSLINGNCRLTSAAQSWQRLLAWQCGIEGIKLRTLKLFNPALPCSMCMFTLLLTQLLLLHSLQNFPQLRKGGMFMETPLRKRSWIRNPLSANIMSPSIKLFHNPYTHGTDRIYRNTCVDLFICLFNLTNGNRAVFNHHVKDARGRLLSTKEGQNLVQSSVYFEAKIPNLDNRLYNSLITYCAPTLN